MFSISHSPPGSRPKHQRVLVDIPVGFGIAGVVIVVSDPSARLSVQRRLRAGLNLGRPPKTAVYAPS
jgi:hypothetical protein